MSSSCRQVVDLKQNFLIAAPHAIRQISAILADLSSTLKLGIMKTALLILLVLSTQTLAGLREGIDAADRGNYALAVREYTEAAAGGDATARMLLAASFFEGRGVEKNIERAAELYQLAAKQGQRIAQYNLATMYESGKGVRQDLSQAQFWYAASAMRGYPQAQNALGALAYRGDGMPRNYAAAHRWWTRAARQGLPSAQYNLGLLSAQGRGVPQSNTEAYFWWLLSSAGKNEDATAALNKMEKQLTPGEIAKVQASAAEWREFKEPEPE